MPRRLTPLVNGEFYHIFNRGINKQLIFLKNSDYSRAFELLNYYKYVDRKLKYSTFRKLSQDQKLQIWSSMGKKSRKLVDIISFVFMPNHFHLLLKQNEEKGVSNFLSNFQNSYTRYFNTKYNKIGPLLQGQFKSVLIESNLQLLHLSRYIHLNPYSSSIVKKISELKIYPWSSYPEYLNQSTKEVCSKKIILSQFKNRGDYQGFINDTASYQLEINFIKHQLINTED